MDLRLDACQASVSSGQEAVSEPIEAEVLEGLAPGRGCSCSEAFSGRVKRDNRQFRNPLPRQGMEGFAPGKGLQLHGNISGLGRMGRQTFSKTSRTQVVQGFAPGKGLKLQQQRKESRLGQRFKG